MRCSGGNCCAVQDKDKEPSLEGSLLLIPVLVAGLQGRPPQWSGRSL